MSINVSGVWFSAKVSLNKVICNRATIGQLARPDMRLLSSVIQGVPGSH